MSDNLIPDTGLIAGLLVKSGKNEWEILSVALEVETASARIKVHSCDNLFGRYLDVGAEYPLTRLVRHKNGAEVWEIEPEHMKRSASQVLLCVDEGEITIDLDS